MSADILIDSWRQTRSGLIEEAAQIPANQFSFRATPETRSVAEVLQHVIEIQSVLAGETCRPDTSLMRQSFADHIREYAPEVAAVNERDALLELLHSSMEATAATIQSAAATLGETMTRFDGQTVTKRDFLTFAIAHEMYHRGQFTVYERLLNIKPALTARFEKLFAQSG